jgi:hypothetical protein
MVGDGELTKHKLGGNNGRGPLSARQPDINFDQKRASDNAGQRLEDIDPLDKKLEAFAGK